MQSLQADYLVIGVDAMGLGFSDEIIHGCADRRVIMIDGRTSAGGHWNAAHYFLRKLRLNGSVGNRRGRWTPLTLDDFTRVTPRDQESAKIISCVPSWGTLNVTEMSIFEPGPGQPRQSCDWLHHTQKLMG